MYEEQIDVGMQIRRAGWIFEACKCQWEQRTGGRGRGGVNVNSDVWGGD